MTRYAKRVDDNHAAVVADFKALIPEASVFDLSGAGRGITDLIVGLNGFNYLFEIKDGSKPPSARKLTPAQEEFHSGWKGQILVVHNANQMAAEIARVQNANSDAAPDSDPNSTTTL